MLRFLRIRNLAVIEAADVEFDPGFTVLTGETGAGKSILIEAVGLLLGGRASADLVRTGESQATVEAIFEQGDREIVVRREITRQGRSRAFIDGELATGGALRELARDLVELHGQHEHQALLDPAQHLQLLDDYADLTAARTEVERRWSRFRNAQADVDRSRMDARERDARVDLLSFQVAEIARCAPREGEDAELAATRQVLLSAERLRLLCQEGYDALYDSETAVLGGLHAVWKRVAELAELEPAARPYLEFRDAIKSQLEDLATFLRQYGDGIDASPDRLQQIDERLATVERLKKKYGPTLEDVLARWEAFDAELKTLQDPLGNLVALERELELARQAYLDEADALSRARHKAADVFATEVTSVLADLAMPRARFELRFDPSGGEAAWSATGVDTGEFYISPNPGEEPKPLARIVSGGELSRVMLALKALGAKRRQLGESPGGQGAVRTLVFDEVDAGIGGRVAEVVGGQLAALAETFQVLCISHLAQIAAKARTQLAVEKQTVGERTSVRVHGIEGDERVTEVARMLGGTVTDTLRASAAEMLNVATSSGRPTKRKAKGESESRRI